MVRQLLKAPPVSCPALIMNGAADGVEKTPLSQEALRRSFTGSVEVRPPPGISHFPQREAPGDVVRAVVGQALVPDDRCGDGDA
jgi:pimeloyl-ACP methyl ester carboxylesterase